MHPFPEGEKKSVFGVLSFEDGDGGTKQEKLWGESAWQAFQLLGSWYSENIVWQIVAGYSSINVTHDETILHGGVFSFSTHSVHCKRH